MRALDFFTSRQICDGAPQFQDTVIGACSDGARPLKWAIQRELQDSLAVKILSSKFHEGEAIHVERGKRMLEFNALEAEIPVSA